MVEKKIEQKNKKTKISKKPISKENSKNSFDQMLNQQKFTTRKQEAKFISKYRKKYIKDIKKVYRNKLKEVDGEKKENLKKEFKEKISEGNFSNSKDNIIDLINVNKFYTSKESYEHILKDINITIRKGEIVIILGASGSGKTTLLNVLSGLTDATSGDVIVNNKNLFYLNETQKTKFRAENLSFVFQSYNLIPTLTVSENIKVGYNLKSKDKVGEKVSDILKILAIEEQAKKYPFQLSGGQNQRVSIGRALAKSPEILFADEPTGALDEKHGKDAIKLLIDINKKYNTTLIMVTHNPNFSKIGDKIIRVIDGEIAKIEKNEKRSDNVDSIKWV